MILNLLNGKFGSLRQRLMFLLIGLALLGIFFLFASPYFYFQQQEEQIWVSGMLWINGLFLLTQLVIATQKLVRPSFQEEINTTQEPQRHSISRLDEEKDIPKGFADTGDKVWIDPYEPIPLHEVMRDLPRYTYARLYAEKLLWIQKGNQQTANWFLNPLKKWTRSQYWKTHSTQLRHVAHQDVDDWFPKPQKEPSPIA